jgi:polysaccharide transporter, PST family
MTPRGRSSMSRPNGWMTSLSISIYVRRTLGPAAIGQVSWTAAVLGYLVILTNPGLTTIGQRELSRDPTRGQKLLALLLTLQSILAVVVYGIVVTFAALEVRGQTVSLLLLIQGLALLLSAGNTAWVIQANERMVAPSIANLVLNALQVPVLFLVVRGPADVYLYAACTLLLPLCGLLFNLWYIGRHRFAAPRSLRPTLRGASRLLRDA